ncbi:MAG: hypothetical protein MUC63_09605 [Planctomycetes bacterium]|nr:hypothetical protein [Planctomycetota bacterium]
MIGAAIWYIPRPPHAWSGFVSRGALEAFHPDSGIAEPRISLEHRTPRKIAAKRLLKDARLTETSMSEKYRNELSLLDYITPEENKSLQRHQRDDVYSTQEEACRKAGIELLAVREEDWDPIRKRDRKTIEKYLRPG